MSDNDFLKELIKRGEITDKGYFHYAHIVACLLDNRFHEQLLQLVNGPVWDGDVISKSYRGELFDLGLAIRCCANGEQGFTAATYFAYSVCGEMGKIKRGEIAA